MPKGIAEGASGHSLHPRCEAECAHRLNSCHMRIAVITVSDRTFSGQRKDVSGPLAVRLLADFGEVEGPAVVRDGVESVQAAICEAADSGADAILTVGGTGITSRDLTPEATEPLLARRLIGVEDLLRDNPQVPTAALSRGMAGVIEGDGRRVFILNAPGSTGGVRDAVAAVGPLLGHIVDQLADGDHPAPHKAATIAIQNRGRSDGSDAEAIVAGVTAEPIDMEALAAAVDDPSAGAVVTFCGQVRNHDDARPVVSIDYEAHPEAGNVVRKIAADVAAGSGACKIAVLHRTGGLRVGEIALGAAVSASHRKEALRVLEAVIEQVKLRLPIWKRQEFADGSAEWTGQA